MGKIKIAIAGVGNCASSLVQGIHYYAKAEGEAVPGVMHNVLGSYRIGDVKPVAAFDVDTRKVGKDLSEAIFAKPNNTAVFCKNIPETGVTVQKAPVLDGVADHMKDHPEDYTFKVSNEPAVDVATVLKNSGADVLLNYMPVGSEDAARYYAQCCLDAGVAFVNCMPVFISSDQEWQKKFVDANLPVLGDDIKAQVGSTIVHRTLARLFAERGVRIERSYQLNVGGNTDFLNMLARDRLASKKKSKTQAVQSILPVPLEARNLHIGPSDYVPWCNDRKLGFIRIEGRKFGDVPVDIEIRLNVEDSPNSAACAIDAIRCAKLAMDRGISGPLISASSYFMKSPPQQYPDPVARQMLEEYIKGERER